MLGTVTDSNTFLGSVALCAERVCAAVRMTELGEKKDACGLCGVGDRRVQYSRVLEVNRNRCDFSFAQNTTLEVIKNTTIDIHY